MALLLLTMNAGLVILLVALLLVAALLFVAAAVKRSGSEPAPVQLIAAGLGLVTIVCLILLLEAPKI